MFREQEVDAVWIHCPPAYVVITLYLAYTSFMGLQLLEVGLNVFKAVFNSIVSFHAFQLYRATPAAELV